MTLKQQNSHSAKKRETLNMHRTVEIENSFEPIDPLEKIDLSDNEEYKRQVWMFGKRNL